MAEDSYLKDVEDKVFQVLVDCPDTRINDNLLIWRYWSRFDDNRIASILYQLTPKGIMKLTSPETITRVRRKLINSESLFKIPSEVTDRRKQNRQTMLEWARQE